MAATFNKKASSIIEGALGKIGCKLWTNTTISEIKSEKGKISGIKLANGEKISTKLLILAIGVRPNIELIKNTPIAVNRGIIVDSSMQTNVPDIYAAGDCCEANDLLSSTNRVIAIWPNAYRQGKIAGYNMTGKKQEQYEGSIAMNSVELAGIPTISAGTPESKDKDSEELEFFDAKQSIYKSLF